MKSRYISLMEKTLEAYTFEHIESYFEDVKTNGLREHGFPRLTANIGILIARGRKSELLPIFTEMMDFCCENIPKVKAANDFSVKEIIFCIIELEGKNIVSNEKIKSWKDSLSTIVPEKCYTQYAKTENDKIFNWALFTALSEYMRTYIGLCDSREFIDRQLCTQIRLLDENGMYRDDENEPPMVYDLVPRGLFAVLLTLGYDGKYRDIIDGNLKKAGLLTLKMQSVTGEIPYGGRSSQFIHNEAHIAIVLEYEANRYYNEGNFALAGEFKKAVRKALDNAEYWLNKEPIRHIKNRFPTETKYGCEDYAYFDKYMITAASFFYAAQIICHDDIEEMSENTGKNDPYAAKTSDYFHKVFLAAGDYFLELDTHANMHYDASGLGRVHKKGAPSNICMSSPCTKTPNYFIDVADSENLSLAPGCLCENQYVFATDTGSKYLLKNLTSDEKSAYADFDVTFPCGETLTASYAVCDSGVKISVQGENEVAHMLPAFYFDGENCTEIKHGKNTLEITYGGYTCKYTVSGEIVQTDRLACSRHGHYKIFFAKGEKELEAWIQILENK